jgi:hypothetical protein
MEFLKGIILSDIVVNYVGSIRLWNSTWLQSWWNGCECLVLLNQARYKICFLVFEFPHEWRRIGSYVEHGTCGDGEGVHLCVLGPGETLDIYCIFLFFLVWSTTVDPTWPAIWQPSQIKLIGRGLVELHLQTTGFETQDLFELPEWAIQVSQDSKDQILWIYIEYFELK